MQYVLYCICTTYRYILYIRNCLQGCERGIKSYLLQKLESQNVNEKTKQKSSSSRIQIPDHKVKTEDMFAQVASAFVACNNSNSNKGCNDTALINTLIWDRNNVPRTATATAISSIGNAFFGAKVRAQEHEQEPEQEQEQNQNAKRFPPRVVIGGGSGFIGTELVRHLRRRGYDVVIISRASYGKEEGERYHYHYDTNYCINC